MQYNCIPSIIFYLLILLITASLCQPISHIEPPGSPPGLLLLEVRYTYMAAKKQDAKPAKPKKQFQMPKLTLQDILAFVDLACDTLGDLRRKLRVEVLVLHVTLDGSDPAKAAILYGRAWALIGMLNPKLEQLFVIKKRDIQPILDYNEKKMKLDAQLVLTITIGRAICLALRALVRFLKLWLNKKKAVSNT